MNDTDLLHSGHLFYLSYTSSLFIDVTWITCFAFFRALGYFLYLFIHFIYISCLLGVVWKCDERNYLFGEVDEICFLNFWDSIYCMFNITLCSTKEICFLVLLLILHWYSYIVQLDNSIAVIWSIILQFSILCMFIGTFW